MNESNAKTILARHDFDAVLFDLDGVITRTVTVHAKAWKATFDPFLESRNRRLGESQPPFDPGGDYLRYVDGKPRYEGVKSFLESRGIELAFGDPSDSPNAETVCGVGNRKNQLFREIMERDGVEVFTTSVEFVHALRDAGFKVAVVSSSKNAVPILNAAGLRDLFDACFDGIDGEKLGVPGKPNPAAFVEATKLLGAEPARTVVIEDATAGVQAGRRGGFALVVGVDRAGQAQALSRAGADVVVSSLAELAVAPRKRDMDAALEEVRRAVIGGAEVAVFLDYDGTLTPIVSRPELAVLSQAMRDTLQRLARVTKVAIVSGRDRRDVEGLVGLPELIYAGSHGFDITLPSGHNIQNDGGKAVLPVLDEVEQMLAGPLKSISGTILDRKKFAIAVHYRLVDPSRVADVEALVDRALEGRPELRKTGGKMVFELRPNVEWDKGRAVMWLLEALGLARVDVLPIYIGDDETDEDAFGVLSGRGMGVRVLEAPRPTAAGYRFRDVDEVQHFLENLVRILVEGTQ
jgi:trehalose 6-phosphate phosphatase